MNFQSVEEKNISVGQGLESLPPAPQPTQPGSRVKLLQLPQSLGLLQQVHVGLLLVGGAKHRTAHRRAVVWSGVAPAVVRSVHRKNALRAAIPRRWHAAVADPPFPSILMESVQAGSRVGLWNTHVAGVLSQLQAVIIFADARCCWWWRRQRGVVVLLLLFGVVVVWSRKRSNLCPKRPNNRRFLTPVRGEALGHKLPPK